MSGNPVRESVQSCHKGLGVHSCRVTALAVPEVPLIVWVRDRGPSNGRSPCLFRVVPEVSSCSVLSYTYSRSTLTDCHSRSPKSLHRRGSDEDDFDLPNRQFLGVESFETRFTRLIPLRRRFNKETSTDTRYDLVRNVPVFDKP